VKARNHSLAAEEQVRRSDGVEDKSQSDEIFMWSTVRRRSPTVQRQSSVAGRPPFQRLT